MFVRPIDFYEKRDFNDEYMDLITLVGDITSGKMYNMIMNMIMIDNLKILIDNGDVYLFFD